MHERTRIQVVGGRPRYTMRLGRGERRILEAAAAQSGEPLSTYIRRVALERARRELVAEAE